MGLGIAILVWTGAAPVGADASVGTHGDPYRAEQWALEQIGAARAWPVSTGQGIRIGVVDTGVDLTHEDLADKVVAATNCVGSNGDPGACSGSGQDLDGHGTVVSGVAAADTGNGRGIAGVAPGATLVVARALAGGQPAPVGTPDDVNAAIKWVVDHGARVVNLSLGVAYLSGRTSASPLAPGLDYAWTHGAIPVVASGNVSPGGVAVADNGYVGVNVVVVGATDREGDLAPYSRPFPAAPWGLVAPGGSGSSPNAPGYADANVLSTAPPGLVRTGYAYAAGTSLAAPHVSGALALLLARGLSPLDAVQRLVRTADTSHPCGAGCNGRLDVGRAVDSVKATAGARVPAPAPPSSGPPNADRETRPTGTPTTVVAPVAQPAAEPDPAAGGVDQLPLPADGRPTLAANLSRPSRGPFPAGTGLVLMAACLLLLGTVVRRWARPGS